MFLCPDCHNANGGCLHFSSSYGKCEDCGKTADCIDCKSHKTKPPPPPPPPKLHQRWQLNLCFDTKLTRVEDGGKSPSEVLVCLVADANRRVGDVFETVFMPELLRFRSVIMSGKGSSKRMKPSSRVRGFTEDSYSAEIAELSRQPGIKELPENFDLDFDEYRQIPLAFHPTRPAFYRCTSLGPFRESNEVVIYLPPSEISLVLNDKTPTGKHLPTEPTLYESSEAAEVIPTLLQLWAADEELRDTAVLLEAHGAEGMVTARAAYRICMDQRKGLPFLTGSLKQVAWASEIRNKTVEALRIAQSAGAPKDPTAKHNLADYLVEVRSFLKPAKAKGADLVQRLHEELKYAEDAKSWIDHRFKPFAWLIERSESRAKIDPSLFKAEPKVEP